MTPEQLAALHLTFFEWLQRLHAEQYTGSIVVHFAQGRPTVIEFPKESTSVHLDNGRGTRDTVSN
jgi:hypothetical protein|tara:strand:+ start:40 stop:234 length:195 start_codon:yes stop_codon:yes gene_type:complete